MLLACLPTAIKWLKQRAGTRAAGGCEQTTVVSAVAVGPSQRVVTVEVGQEGARVQLTLGVTAQSIICLHSAPVAAPGSVVP